MRLLIIALILWIGCAAPSVADDTLTIADFTSEVLEALEKENPEIFFERTEVDVITYKEDEQDEQAGYIYTNNVYSYYKSDPEDKTAFIESWISAMPLDGWVDESNIKARLVTVLRPTDYLDGGPTELKDTVISRAFAGEIMAVLMLDSPQTLSSASPDLLAENGLTEDQAFILAEGNTRRLMGEIQSETIEGIELLSSESGLITGLPALSESCSTTTKPYIVLIIDRDTLYQTSISEDNPGFAFLNVIAADAIGSGESLATGMLFCRDGEWGFAVPGLPID